MIKRAYCKENFKYGNARFKKGDIYEACRHDDDFTGGLEIFNARDKIAILEIENGELICGHERYFTLIRHCYEEYVYKGELEIK